MSVDAGGGSTEGWRVPAAAGGTGQPGLASVPETYAAYLFDYCDGILRDPDAAAEAVRQALTIADAQAGQFRDPDRIRVQLYSRARRQCLDGPPGRSGSPRGKPVRRGAGRGDRDHECRDHRGRGRRTGARDAADRAGCARRAAGSRSRGAQSCLRARIRCRGPRRSGRNLAPASPLAAVPGEQKVREVRGRRCGAVCWLRLGSLPGAGELFRVVGFRFATADAAAPAQVCASCSVL